MDKAFNLSPCYIVPKLLIMMLLATIWTMTQPQSSLVLRLKILGCPQKGGKAKSLLFWSLSSCMYSPQLQKTNFMNNLCRDIKSTKHQLLWGLLELVGRLPQPQWLNFMVSWLFSEDVKGQADEIPGLWAENSEDPLGEGSQDHHNSTDPGVPGVCSHV